MAFVASGQNLLRGHADPLPLRTPCPEAPYCFFAGLTITRLSRTDTGYDLPVTHNRHGLASFHDPKEFCEACFCFCRLDLMHFVSPTSQDSRFKVPAGLKRVKQNRLYDTKCRFRSSSPRSDDEKKRRPYGHLFSILDLPMGLLDDPCLSFPCNADAPGRNVYAPRLDEPQKGFSGSPCMSFPFTTANRTVRPRCRAGSSPSLLG